MIRVSWLRVCAYGLAAACLLGLGTTGAEAQPAIFSFEDGLQSWTSDHVTLSQSSLGATDGTSALLIDDLNSGFRNNVATTPNFGPATVGLVDAYNAFALAASVIAAGGTPQL